MNLWWWRRKIHASWMIAFCCSGILIGILLAKYLCNPWFGHVAILTMSFLLLTVSFCWRKTYLVLMVILGGALFGLWRGSLIQGSLQEYEPLFGRTVTVHGTVSDDADIDSSGQATLRLSNVKIAGKALTGMLWVTTTNDDIKRGDQVAVSGKLLRGFGNFSGIIYRANLEKIIRPASPDLALQLRDWFAGAIRKVLPEPEASLGIGYLVGQRRALPADLVEALQLVGLTHIVVASGYNLTILVRLARRLLAKISKYLATLVAFLMVIGFLAVTGASPSMVRAGLVATLSLLAWYYGREFHPIVLLLLAMAATALVNPGYLWGDLGWQLSFAAFAGVMILAPLVQKYFWGDTKPSVVGQILVETISAQIAVMPIIVMVFSQFSNIALVANLLILPFVPLAMLLVFIAGIAGAIGGFVVFLSLPANWLLGYMIKTIDCLASLPWAASEIKIGLWQTLVYYVLLLVICIYLWRSTKYHLRESNIIE